MTLTEKINNHLEKFALTAQAVTKSANYLIITISVDGNGDFGLRTLWDCFESLGSDIDICPYQTCLEIVIYEFNEEKLDIT